MESKFIMAALLLASCPAAAQNSYSIGGTSAFIQDLDDADGVDLISGLVGTWSGSFTIPNPADLTFVSNSQNQGGSLTRYSGVTLDSLTLFTELGEIEANTSPIVGTLSLWDRQSFGSGQRQLELSFNLLGTTARLSFTVNNGVGVYDTLFNVGTPNPNTLTNPLLPLFDDAAERASFFNSVTVSLDGNLPILPGRGRYNGNATQLVPAPASVALIGLASLGVARRRRA